ncbi:MAG: ubiquitin-like domain-containing protein, partial [Spirochaetaceae bacterium]|nr:ubiquitin-like domain-containing protein [Spirochaetaceae bacterium]
MTRDRLPALLLQGAVVLGLVVATTAFVTSDKTVTVSVEGKTREVRTFASTVGDVLADEGLAVDTAHDLVIPTSEQQLRDGETIVVRYGRPVLLTVDGQTRTVWTTADSV